jgi:osmoprotectant transport system permease protein
MDPALMLAGLAAGQVDVISVYSTDGRIESEGLAVLEDDLGVIPPYDAILLASPRLARERPDLIAALAALEGAIDAPAMRRMNLAVDGERKSPAEVAREFAAGLPEKGR